MTSFGLCSTKPRNSVTYTQQNCDDPLCPNHPKVCHPERSEGPMHLSSAQNPPSPRKRRASSAPRHVLYSRECSGHGETGRAKVRPKPCTIGHRGWTGHSAKITLSEAVTYVYWAQACLDSCFYGSGGNGPWSGLPRVLPG